MELELYQMEGCPFCGKVRQTLSELGLSFTAHNPRQNEERMQELLELGGEDQVPFLVVRDDSGEVVETLYESDDIVDWLEEEFGG
ncbi:MAG: glutathione S-transferase N-terminal domain-containing protein [Candidatus Nanohaloarchaea archaeon]|nr:glutathione S-transferase N-terminal domain-containing protein [Candidatus Nanohaloarchaea archaeon]